MVKIAFRMTQKRSRTIKKEYQILNSLLTNITGKKYFFLSHQRDWKKFEENNKSISLNILYVSHNTKQIRLAYKSKYNHKCYNQVVLLMITDGEKWHYLAVRRLSALLRRITSNHNGDFYCLNCLHSYRTKNMVTAEEKTVLKVFVKS